LVVIGRMPHNRQVVYKAKKEIHYNKTFDKILNDARVILLDSEKDVILFDMKRPTEELKKGFERLAHIQISPRGKINLYVDEGLQKNEIDKITEVLRDLIVDESGSGIELEPITVIASRTRIKPDWLSEMILQLKLPIKVIPKRLQMIFSTKKKQIDNSDRG